jgi:[protein-PII] uridylyltransferase
VEFVCNECGNLVSIRDPVAFIRALHLQNECPVSDATLGCIRQHAERFSVEDFFPAPPQRTALLQFLRPAPGLYARLSEMHDCGLLGRMFPPFQAITYRVVRDFFHKYTVDEHTLLTIRNLERLTRAATPSGARFGSGSVRRVK